MMNGRKKWLLAVAFLLSAALTVLFAFRAVHHRPHRRVDEPIRPWMTIDDLAHSYHAPRRVISEALAVQHHQPDKLRVARVDREQNRRVASVINDLMGAINQARPNAPVSPPGSTRSPGSSSSARHESPRLGGTL